jgi:C4-dicarboxylate transporter DctM subunit
MLTLIFIAFLVLIFSGTPIVFALGLTSALFLGIMEVPLNTVSQRMIAGLDSFPIMAIPFFVLAGQIMEKGGIAKRIVEWASALVGWITGSLLLVTIVAGTGFAAVSGSGSAATAAIASIMLPEMRKRGYNIDFSAVTLAAAGVLGPIIPPSIMMIVLATCSSVPISVEDLFLGGVLPGIIMACGLMLYSWRFACKHGDAYKEDVPFTLGRLLRTTVHAIPAFLMPVIIVGGIIGGVFTPTEAAAVAVFVGLFVSFFIYRELSIKELPEVIIRSAAISSSIMMIIATATIFSWLIANKNVPELLASAMMNFSDSPYVFLILINIALIIIGMFMESNSAILILIPVLMPMAVNNFGIDPVHLGVLVVANLSVGMLTPPYGICLFVSASISGRSITQVSRYVWIPTAILIATLLLMTYVPQTVTFLPSLFK